MLEKSELATRIAVAIKESPHSQEAIARLIGVTEQAVSGWVRTGKISKDNLPKLASLTSRPLAYFLSRDQGTPAAANSSITDRENASLYVRVSQLDAEAGMGSERVNDDYPEIIRSVDYASDFIRAVVGFVPPPGRLVLVTGRGDSMLPTIQPGESVLVDTGVSDFDGDGLYLINAGNGQQVKRLQDFGDAIHVVSDNSAYAPFPLPRGASIGGKVYLRNRVERFN